MHSHSTARPGDQLPRIPTQWDRQAAGDGRTMGEFLDKWDRKAERVQSVRHDHTGMPIDAIVAVTELNLSFGTIFRLALFFAMAQAIIGAVILIILLALGTI